MRAFWIALQFLTRLPAPMLKEYTPKDRGRSVLYYPLIGLIIGALLVLMHTLLTASDAGVRSALLLTSWVLVTGGLHLDGLADSADAWLGGHGDRTRTLEILHDPRSGPAAIMLVVLVLIVKFAALQALPPKAWPVLLIAPVLGRAAMVGLFLTTAYVRAHGLGSAQAQYLPRRTAAWILLACAVGILALAPGAGWLLLGVTLIVVYLLRRLMIKRLGGTTGDTLGATCEIIEALILVTWVLGA